MTASATCGLILSLALAALPGAAATSVSIRAHGAEGDGSSLDTAVIQKSLDDCATGGGGAVFFEVSDDVELRTVKFVGGWDGTHWRGASERWCQKVKPRNGSAPADSGWRLMETTTQ